MCFSWFAVMARPSANIKTRGNLPARGPGRPKGTPNKITAAAKDAIAQAAANLGGANRIVEWAKEDPKNEAAFWTSIYPKLIPVQLNGPEDADGNPTRPFIEIRLVQPQ